MRFQSFQARLLSLALVSVVFPSAVSAADGVMEINQAKVAASGGFPFIISQPGSYRLTSNLTVTDPNLDAIDINAVDVSLDLNGFEIIGPVTCGGLGSTCGTAGTGVGIRGVVAVHVRHGAVRSFASDGVVVDYDSQIDDLLVTSNGHRGIGVINGSQSRLVVEDATAFSNGDLGIDAGPDSVVQRCIAVGNGTGGISTSFRSLVVENAASNNGVAGIRAPSGSVIRDNVASNNHGSGIVTAQGSLVTDNSTYGNTGDGIDVGLGDLVSDNAESNSGGNGIVADAGSAVQGNTATHNGAVPLFLVPTTAGTNPAAYLENVIDSNGFGIQGGVNIRANYCNGTPCP